MTRGIEQVGFATKHAWVDESMRFGSDGPGPVYILAAVVSDLAGSDDARDELRSLLLRGQKRIHWRDEDHARRMLIAKTIARLDLTAVVVVGARLVESKQERARRQCLRRLLHELELLGVSRVLLESRGAG